jgi:hypothetical protein
VNSGPVVPGSGGSGQRNISVIGTPSTLLPGSRGHPPAGDDVLFTEATRRLLLLRQVPVGVRTADSRQDRTPLRRKSSQIVASATRWTAESAALLICPVIAASSAAVVVGTDSLRSL